MEPVSLIASALVAGAAAAAGKGVGDGLTEVVKSTVVSMYDRLKTAITAKAKDDPGSARTLERHAANPDGYQTPVTDLLVEAGADRDPDIIAIAHDLMAAVDPAGAQVGKYNVTITDSNGTQVGDHNTQTTTGPSIGGSVHAGRDANIATHLTVDNRGRSE